MIMVRQIAHIIIPPKEKRSAALRIFTAEITPDEEADRGFLFGLFVIDYYHHRNDEIIDSIIEELQGRYYDPDITMREPEALLEETLRALNTTLAQLIEHEQIFLNLKRFHAVIGVLRGKSITFTHIGDFTVYLQHQSVGQKQHLIDLIATTEGPDAKKSPPPTRIFSNLVSGSLRTNDAVFFATTSLFDYITKERVQKIISGIPAPRALEQLKTLMKTERNTMGIIALLVRLAPEHEGTSKDSSQDSIASLQATEDDTRRYLAPSVFRNVLKQGWALYMRSETALRQFLRIPSDAPRKALLFFGIRYLLAALRIIGRTLLAAQRFMVIVLKILRDIVQKQNNWKGAFDTLKKQSQEGVTPLFTESKKRFTGMTIRQRTLLIAAITLAIVLVISTTVLGVQRSRTRKQQTYKRNIALVQERMNTAEASLLFKDEVRTKAIYAETIDLIATLPARSKVQKETRDALTREVTERLEKLRHIVQIDRIDVIKDFRELDPAVALNALTIVDDNAYVAHASRPLIYKVNLTNKQALTLDASGVDVRLVKHIAEEEKGDALYLSFDTAGIATLHLERQAVAQTDITFGAPGTTINDITLYNKRLYILDTANNQIWRHEKTKAGFGKGVAWLKGENDFANARSFAIDGALWIVNADKVIQFVRGKQTSWKLDAIDPPAVSLRKVFARNNGTKLWLLDEATKRVLAVDKASGKLVAQYPLPADDVRDFFVNEKTGQILLLTKTKLLALSYEKE